VPLHPRRLGTASSDVGSTLAAEGGAAHSYSHSSNRPIGKRATVHPRLPGLPEDLAERHTTSARLTQTPLIMVIGDLHDPPRHYEDASPI
jgi:hypothetical protein